MTLIEIEQLLREQGTKKAYDELILFLNGNIHNAEGWYLMGNILRREERWGDAINAYNKAKFLNPEGPAANAIEAIYDIIRYTNTDLMNP